MKLFTTSQIRQIDQLTIKYEPISSIGLMERTGDRILQQFKKDFSYNRDVLILAGPGNNGGDGLALGRMLIQSGYDAQLILLKDGALSADCKANKERLLEYFPESLTECQNKFVPAEISAQTVIVDALFGSGLSRPLGGIFKDAVDWINTTGNDVVSIDIPSGLNGDSCAGNDETIVKANITYTLQFPKIALLFPENEKFVGEWKLIDIQLHPKAIAETETHFHYLDKADIKKMVKPRSRFSHKGTFGHTLIWAGKKGMAGASVLATKGALRAGAGLVSVHSVEENRVILQSAVPEAIFLNEINSLENYNSFAFGPGLGTDEKTAEMLKEVLNQLNRKLLPSQKLYSTSPLTRERAPEGRERSGVRSEFEKSTNLVLDADALNIISQNPKLLEILSKNTILTPHPKEFERLFRTSANSLERMEKASEKAKELNIIIVLKSANTLIALPDGRIFFNSTGNSGMAVGGMGDVLTGIIAGLLAQNYTPETSALLGVFLHGLAGDLALGEQSQESLMPSDVIENLGNGFKKIRE